MWVVDLALKRVGRCFGPDDRRVVLRHNASGQVFTDGSGADVAVTFVDQAAAFSFRRRFMDEHDAWEAVSIDGDARAA